MAYTTIDNPTKFFSTTLWVADNASSRSLTGFGHQLDIVWTKHRDSGATNPTFTDSVRGGDKQMGTSSNAAEDSGSHGKISSFDSDGITVIDGTNGTYPRLYFNSLNPFGASVGGNYVGWSWKAGGSASSNSDGGITSSVSANTTAGISVVSYAGTGSAATVGHGLGVAPRLIIIKNRSSTESWRVYHGGLGATKEIYFDLTSAAGTSSSSFNDTEPTSSVFSVGTGNGTNKSGDNLIAYCFAEKQGFSKFATYEGNGSSDGTFIYTGFRPAFLITKRADTGGDNWHILDNKRDIDNPTEQVLQTNEPTAEATTTTSKIDFLSNGFKCRGTGSSINTSGLTYIYIAFAESPFVNSNGIPNNAR